MKKRYLILAAMLTASSVIASPMKAMVSEGGRVGNGGGLVVCRNSTSRAIQSVELIDYYEARTYRQVTLDLASLHGTWQERAQQLINRLQKLSPMRVDIYSEWLKRFEKEARFVKDSQFATIPDTGFIAIPNGCEFEQGVVQLQPRFPGDARYSINSPLWDAMDDSQRAGLVLHEFLYREAIGYGHTDSISARHLNGVIAGTGFPTLYYSSWLQLLILAKYEMTDANYFGLDRLNGLDITLDLGKIWQPGPDENVMTLHLKDRLPVSLGVCSEDGCSHFNSQPKPDQQNVPSPNVILHPMVTCIRFNGFRFSQDMATARRNFTGMVFKDEELKSLSWFALDSGKPSGAYLNMDSANMSGFISSVSFDHQLLDWMTAFNLITPTQVIRGDGTQRFKVWSFNSKSFKQIIADSLPLPDEYPTRVEGVFSGGHVSLTTSRLGEELNFTPAGEYWFGGSIAELKFPATQPDDPHTPPPFWYFCRGSHESDCMTKGGDLREEQLNLINVKAEVTYMGTKSAAMLAPQVLELYPSGAFKSAVISATGHFTKRDGTSVNFGPGETVKLDEEGYLL